MQRTTPTPQEKSVLATATYFDLFSYPLTPFEIWKWFYTTDKTQQTTLDQVFLQLRTSTYLAEKLETHEGFYFLRGNKEHVVQRKERYLIAERKYRRVLAVSRVFRHLPFVRAVGVCNSLSYSNAREESDLDFFIITAPGRIWTARQFVTGLAALRRWRPTASQQQDTVCLSYFVSEDALSLEHLALQADDVHMRYWLAQIKPVYDPHRIFETFWEANTWMRERLPNVFSAHPSHQRTVLPSASHIVRRFAEALHRGTRGNLLEQRYRMIQHNILPDRLRVLANRDSRVVLTDHVLKFHDNDRRDALRTAFAERLAHVL